MKDIQNKLFELCDSEYKKFHSSLVPTIDLDKIIGVRVPTLRKFAREFFKTTDTSVFCDSLPHKYYEENSLHAFLICEIKNFDECITALNKFLPYVDNWGTCDSIRPKCFAKNKDSLILHIENWLNSSHTYTVRFGIEMLMTHFLDEGFDKRFLERVSEIESQEYYVNMMVSWYFATALAKQWESAIPFIEENRLGDWVHNKTIQKAVESYRITEEQKNYLKALRKNNR